MLDNDMAQTDKQDPSIIRIKINGTLFSVHGKKHLLYLITQLQDPVNNEKIL